MAHIAEAVDSELRFTVKETGVFSESTRPCTTAEWEARPGHCPGFLPQLPTRRSGAHGAACACGARQARLAALAARVEGFRRSFEYIQDYVNIAGLRVWEEETSRIISYNVERECNAFLKHRQVHDWESAFQSDVVPIPRFAPLDDGSATFMGRLARELLRQTDPVRTVYLYPLTAWYDCADGLGAEVLGIRALSLLRSAVGVAGLVGLDRLLSFMLLGRLQGCVAHYRSRLDDGGGADLLAAIRRGLGPPAGLPDPPGGAAPLQFYAESAARCAKVLAWGPLQEATTFLGQAQLLRRQIASELSGAATLDSDQLICCLDNANDGVLEDVRAHYRAPEAAPHPAPSSPLLPSLSELLTAAGLHNPLAQIYIAQATPHSPRCAVTAAACGYRCARRPCLAAAQEPLRELPAALFFFTLSQLPRYGFDHHLATLRPVRRYLGAVPDAAPLVVGIATLLRQSHASATHAYLALLGQYARVQAQQAAAAVAASPKSAALPAAELVTLVAFLDAFCRASGVPRSVITLHTPPHLLDSLLGPQQRY